MDDPADGGLSHAALFYRSQPECVAAIVAFVQAGLAAGEPTLVAVPGTKASVICDQLPAVPGEVVFTDMAGLGRNRQQVLTHLLGVGQVDLGRERHDRHAADPDQLTFTRHGPTPPVEGKGGSGRVSGPKKRRPRTGQPHRHSCASPHFAQADPAGWLAAGHIRLADG